MEASLTIISLLLVASGLPAATHYVSLESTNPTPPYTNWLTAATNIQDAVNAALAGDEIVVSNGIYASGRRMVGTNLLFNRVAVDKALALRSASGPTNTVIQGYQAPGTTNGDSAVRCVYLSDGASLSGFTLTNGATRPNKDNSLDQNGGGVWCESTNSVVTNCVIVGNSAYYHGGGVYGGTLDNCTLTGNSAGYGGGASDSTLNNCILSGNSATEGGGGAYGSTLYNCALSGNSANWLGGGACLGTLNNCTLRRNFATNWWFSAGGGASGGTLNNCILIENSARYGGGASPRLWSPGIGLYNCILYFNTAMVGANYEESYSTLNFCCTTPLPDHGLGNIDADPLFMDYANGNLRLQSNSPCINAGDNLHVQSLTDLDGKQRLVGDYVDIGAYEYQLKAPTPVSPSIQAVYTRVVPGTPLEFTAQIGGHATASRWDFGDGTVVSNQLPSVAHSWAETGDYKVTLWAYNDDNPGGISASVIVNVVPQPVHYVNANSASPAAPYTSWASSAADIQSAVDAAETESLPPGSVLVLVSNGVYAAGGRAVPSTTTTNRVVVDKPLVLRSVNGPQFTVIEGLRIPGTTNGCGDGAIRCVYLTNDASLSGFTVTNGATQGSWDLGGSGGGIWCESRAAVISNCVVVGNSAAREGGGVCGGTLSDCILATNTTIFGGGTFDSTLTHCTFIGNSAWEGGGACGSTLNDCMLTLNRGVGDVYASGGAAAGSFLNSCTLASNSVARLGGGAMHCVLNSCILTGNTAGYGGGGAYEGNLNNCTLTANSAGRSGGGGQICTLNNCIVYFNTAPQGANYFQERPDTPVSVNYSCITPIPPNGVGNIMNAPLFADYPHGNLHLLANSPCINAGNNSFVSGRQYDPMGGAEFWVTNLFDLDGNPRIVSGTVDIGAYEYQGTGSRISYAWLQQYALPTDGSADLANADGDGMNNWQEWVSGTCPTNGQSVLRLLAAVPTATNVTLTWQSVAGVSYFVERSDNLVLPFTPIATDIVGLAGTTSFADTTANGAGPFFYRVGVATGAAP